MKTNKESAMILGVCAGLAKKFNIDPTIVRLGFVVAALISFGIPVMLYIIMAIVMPNE